MNLEYSDLGDRFMLSAPHRTFSRLFPSWKSQLRVNGGPPQYDDYLQGTNMTGSKDEAMKATINKYSLFVAAAVNMGLIGVDTHLTKLLDSVSRAEI